MSTFRGVSPCASHPRGFTDTKIPWDDVIQDDPCVKKILTSMGGTDVSAESLCLFHWLLKNGSYRLKPPIVIEP